MTMFQVPKRKRLFYSAEDDFHLLREVVGQNPYLDQERWQKIKENVLPATGKAFTLRSIKERVTLLSEKFAAKVATDEYKSGIEEEVTELDDLLHAILLLMNDFTNIPKKESKSQYQKGFDKRELAQNNNKENVFDNMVDHNEGSNFENEIHCIVVSDEHHEALKHNSNDDISIEEPKTPNINSSITSAHKTSKATGNSVGTPVRVRPGGLKQTSIRYLEKKIIAGLKLDAENWD